MTSEQDNAVWVEINIPWYTSLERIEEYKTLMSKAHEYNQFLEEKEREHFGKTLTESRNELPYSGAMKEVENKYGLTLSEVQELTNKEIAELKIRINNDNNAYALKLFEHRLLYLEREKWLDAGGFRDFLLPYKMAAKEAQGRLSFRSIPACRPGVLVEVKRSSGEIKQYLIGDINPDGYFFAGEGEVLEKDDLVLRYKVVYDSAE
jgi:hypothetical protein